MVHAAEVWPQTASLSLASSVLAPWGQSRRSRLVERLTTPRGQSPFNSTPQTLKTSSVVGNISSTSSTADSLMLSSVTGNISSTSSTADSLMLSSVTGNKATFTSLLFLFLSL